MEAFAAVAYVLQSTQSLFFFFSRCCCAEHGNEMCN